VRSGVSEVSCEHRITSSCHESTCVSLFSIGIFIDGGPKKLGIITNQHYIVFKIRHYGKIFHQFRLKNGTRI